MRQLAYQITFTTPAFLGNADQVGQWRTPPFKALLRQWWRVAYAAGRQARVDIGAMRSDEGRLFGVASDGRDGSRKSQIRLRLDRWDLGRQKTWQPMGKVQHPEVKFPIDSGLYLGYGPVTLPRGARQPALKKNAAIQAGESATLSLAFPDDQAALIESALWCLNQFGTLGGRSRNGWGSFAMTPADARTPALATHPANGILRTWQDALTLDWPHAIGRDDAGPLIWQTNAHDADWKSVMHRLAEIKIRLRTLFPFRQSEPPPHPRPLDRHWLSYPITKHGVSSWNRNLRLPNSLRFKVRPDPDGRLRGLIFHVPCAPPPDFRPDPEALHRVWSRVHRFLDQPDQALTRITDGV